VQDMIANKREEYRNNFLPIFKKNNGKSPDNKSKPIPAKNKFKDIESKDIIFPSYE
jgi:hypothetical protein